MVSSSKAKAVLFDSVYRYGTVMTVIILVLFFGMSRESFFTYGNIADILRSIAIVTVIALGMTFSLSVNGLDFSVASVAGLANILSAGIMVYYDFGLAWAVIFPLCTGALIGAVNSFLVVVIRIPDLLATLSMFYIIKGSLLTYCKGYSIYSHMTRVNGAQAPGEILPQFTWFGQGYIGLIPVPIIIMLLLVGSVHLFFQYTKYGRYMYAIGGNLEAARLAGIHVARYRCIAYMLSGFFASIGGLILTARLGSGQVDAGAPYMLDAAAAVFIGFSVFGIGKPNAIGTFLGAMLLGVLVNGMTMMNVPFYSQDIIRGLVLTGALVLTYYKKKS